MAEKYKTIKREMSICCGAPVDVAGGGYDGEYLCPIIWFCTKCREECEARYVNVRVAVSDIPELPF